MPDIKITVLPCGGVTVTHEPTGISETVKHHGNAYMNRYAALSLLEARVKATQGADK